MSEETSKQSPEAPVFRSGFVNIVGRPNVGKSTLMNALVGERMSIITSKPQTTRHRLIGILSGEHFQIVFSDTPGYVKDPAYKMHRAMNRFVEGSVEDADIMLAVVDLTEQPDEDNPLIPVLKRAEAPLILVLNKRDLVDAARIAEIYAWWQERIPFHDIVVLSALNTEEAAVVLEKILALLPEGPEYYPADQLTDRPERFFVSEIIREKILLQYADEIPYACEVGIESYQDTQTKEGVALARIHAIIYVMRDTQKGILLGKGGKAIKKLGMAARADLEAFLQCKVFLELTVKVRSNWRDDEQALQRFGYS